MYILMIIVFHTTLHISSSYCPPCSNSVYYQQCRHMPPLNVHYPNKQTYQRVYPLNNYPQIRITTAVRWKEHSQPPTLSRKSFEKGYRYTQNIGWHKLHTKSTNWNEARNICYQEGGHLAIINSRDEAMALSRLLNESGTIASAYYPGEAFIGLHDQFSEGEFVTILGDPLDQIGFRSWSHKWNGQPDNGGGLQEQDCVALDYEVAMDDVDCTKPFPFFCEIPLYKCYQN